MQGFCREKHVEYLLALDKSKDVESIGMFLRNHLKVAGGYWCLTSLEVLKTKLPKEKKEELVEMFLSCQNPDGGCGGNVGHDSHITATHYVVLILSQFGGLDRFNQEAAAKYIAKLQNEDGSFKGDIYGEIDTRFSYCALSCLRILNRMKLVDVNKAVEFVLSCRNFDGGFGGLPLMESHAAYVFCCVGALAAADALAKVDKESLGRWLSRRQTAEGGFNGRPEKLPDVCYSWWVLSSLAMIGKTNMADLEALEGYILRCQDADGGGISDRPVNEVDVFHTFFGIASLSLIDHKKYDLLEVDPIFAIPKVTIREKLPHLKSMIK